jgi:hypothetical protein
MDDIIRLQTVGYENLTGLIWLMVRPGLILTQIFGQHIWAKDGRLGDLAADGRLILKRSFILVTRDIVWWQASCSKD